VPTAANRQPAFAFYSRWQSPDWRFHSIQVLTLDERAVVAMTSFDLCRRPRRIPADLAADDHVVGSAFLLPALPERLPR